MASASLARHIAVVQQQNFLFTGTVLENLIAGWPGAMEADAVAALRTLDCEGLIDELPDGLPADGLLAEAGNRGGKVSLGQRQLLCFARAMVGDRSLLILDEATNAIGTLTELKMQAAFKKLLDGRTSVVVAHRLSLFVPQINSWSSTRDGAFSKAFTMTCSSSLRSIEPLSSERVGKANGLGFRLWLSLFAGC